MKKLYLASKNQGKIEEYKKLLLNVNCQLLLQPESIEVEENGITFRENAIKKASEVSKKTRNYAIADDSGICLMHWTVGQEFTHQDMQKMIKKELKEFYMNLMEKKIEVLSLLQMFVFALPLGM